MQPLRRPRVALWTQEKIESLTTPEVRQLHANALRLSETEIAAVCDTVLAGRRSRPKTAPRQPATRAKSPAPRKGA
jgi:hypothetical protein